MSQYIWADYLESLVPGENTKRWTKEGLVASSYSETPLFDILPRMVHSGKVQTLEWIEYHNAYHFLNSNLFHEIGCYSELEMGSQLPFGKLALLVEFFLIHGGKSLTDPPWGEKGKPLSFDGLLRYAGHEKTSLQTGLSLIHFLATMLMEENFSEGIFVLLSEPDLKTFQSEFKKYATFIPHCPLTIMGHHILILPSLFLNPGEAIAGTMQSNSFSDTATLHGIAQPGSNGIFQVNSVATLEPGKSKIVASGRITLCVTHPLAFRFVEFG